MKKFLGCIALLVLALCLVGCSSSPSTSQVEKDVRTAIDDSSTNTLYSVLQVNKTNGKKVGDGYEAEVEYTLKFKRDFRDWAAETKSNGNPMAELGVQLFSMMYGEFKVGEVKKNKMWFAYSKTEKGWQFDGPKKDKTSANSISME
jgi:hypothetical protein